MTTLSNDLCHPCKGIGWRTGPSANLMEMVHRKCGWCGGSGKAQHVMMVEDKRRQKSSGHPQR